VGVERELDTGRARGTGSTSTPTRLPDGWSPDPESPENREAAEHATARGVNVADQLASLRDRMLETGEQSRDWNARWRRWLRGAHPATSQATGQRDQRVGRVEPRPPSAYKRGDVDVDTFQVIPGTEPTTDQRLSWAAEARARLGHEQPDNDQGDEPSAGSEP
jgi:hypothetical protein